tara:strand:+ start:1022 stop:1411 length:390 start_codon:yes stop_codon:yes gene_type:complete
MNKRVQITYSVDLEDLDEEVTRLMETATLKVKKAVEIGEEINQGTAVLSVQTMEAIQRLRQSLARADFGLSDASSLIGGYLNYVATTHQHDSAQDSAAMMNERLRDKVDTLKKAFIEEEADDENPSQEL